MQPLTKVLVIGADSGDPDMIERFIKAGDLPNLEALKARALSARIENPVGCDSGSAWTTFHSGLNPGHQPQFDGVRYFDPKDYSFKAYRREEAAPVLVDELSKAGQHCFVMDAPYTHLRPDINGIAVVDWLSHGSVDGTGELAYETKPASVAEEILTLVGSDPAGGIMCDDYLPETAADCQDFLRIHLERIRKKTRIIKHYLAKGAWDYFEAVYCDLHCVGHHLWHVNDKHHPRYRASLEAALGQPIRDCLIALDHAVGDILAMLDDRTIVIFYASHGIGPQYTATGLLDRLLFNLEHGRKMGGHGRTLKGRLRSIWRSIPPDIRAGIMPVKQHFSGALMHDEFLPDRHKRRYFEVYCTNGTGGVRVNLKGREAHGIVDPDDYNATLAEVSQAMSELVNVETGEPLVQKILRMHELFPGPYANGLPDLALIWNKHNPIRIVKSDRLGTLAQEYADARTGDHSGEGLFYAAGTGIPPLALNHKVRSVDFAPTLRDIFGLAQQFTDGEPINALLGAKSACRKGGLSA